MEMFLHDKSIKDSLNVSKKLHETYEDILESYVSDFYVENHWNKLPECWKNFFDKNDLSSMKSLLNFEEPLNKLYPLSLICLRSLIINYTVSRVPITLKTTFEPDKNFLKYFWKNVKEKKRYEIDLIAKLCQKQATEKNCHYIVDIGSGLGHLSRMLSYGYGFKVCTFEANEVLAKSATELDNKFEYCLNFKAIKHFNSQKTVHIHKKITADINSENFLNEVLKHFKGDKNLKFGLIGLHPCGDLGPTLLRLFNEIENISFICIASCCYMKMSINKNFPLSNYCKINNFHLNYLSCEIACHSIENYVEKLTENNWNHLKVHAFRAAVEDIITSFDSSLKHCQLCSVKYKDDLTFKEYYEKILLKHQRCFSDDKIKFYQNVIDDTWIYVVKFYSIRLMLAPIIETIILLDRLLFIRECCFKSCILPIFDPKISPRNLLLFAEK